MKLCVLLLTCCGAFGQYYEKVSTDLARGKRSAVGALHIVTNHAQPIHADVKPENSLDITEKVTAPEDAIYEQKSLRKSLPSDQTSSRLDLVRSISRVITLTVLIVSAVFEFYPMVQHLVESVYYFISTK